MPHVVLARQRLILLGLAGGISPPLSSVQREFWRGALQQGAPIGPFHFWGDSRHQMRPERDIDVSCASSFTIMTAMTF